MNEKKNHFIMKNEKNFMVQNLRATAHLSRQLGRWGAGALVRWGAGAWALGVRGRAGVRQALGVRGRAGGHCRRAGAGLSGRRSSRQQRAGRAAGWASGSRARRARGRAGDGRQARGQAWLGRAGAHGWAHGARGARPAWARPGRLGWPWAVHSVHLAHFRSVLTRFFS